MHQPWVVRGFFACLREFTAEQGEASPAQIELILDWIGSLPSDPLGHPLAELEPIEPGLASVQLPDLDNEGTVIVCYFEIRYATRTVDCRGFVRETAPFQQGTPAPVDPDHDDPDSDWTEANWEPDH